MDLLHQDDKNQFIYPRSRYYGQIQPENWIFKANLPEFCQKVGYITGLQTNGKLSSVQAYREIKLLWKQLKHSKKSLRIGQQPPTIEP